jgi:hypothetical protein
MSLDLASILKAPITNENEVYPSSDSVHELNSRGVTLRTAAGLSSMTGRRP